jgi:hypothetical protein
MALLLGGALAALCIRGVFNLEVVRSDTRDEGLLLVLGSLAYLAIGILACLAIGIMASFLWHSLRKKAIRDKCGDKGTDFSSDKGCPLKP